MQVVSSLTEIAYLLNLRGGDYRFNPVFRGFLIVTHQEIILYSNKTKISVEAQIMLNFDLKTNSCYRASCVQIKNYEEFWKDLQTLSKGWKRVLLPKGNALEMGASEAIFSTMLTNSHLEISEQVSPITIMRALKNNVERKNMRYAQVKDAVAVCDSFSYLEERVSFKNYLNFLIKIC